MPFPYFNYIETSCNLLLQEELSYDRDMLNEEHHCLYSMINSGQQETYKEIIEAITKGEGGVFFVYGFVGTGKTFLWNTLSARLRSEGRVVLNVASSGIASLLLPGGRTTHLRFSIPINLHEDSFCTISTDNNLAGLLRVAELIIWDEAPMMHRHCFEAFDRTMRDLVGVGLTSKPFGGKVIVFGGDFRQILLVITKGRREDIVNATLNSSNIWEYCSVFRLTKNMRLKIGSTTQDIQSIKEFSDWILNIGEGTVGGPNDGEAEIDFPEEFLIHTDGDHLQAISNTIYPSLIENLYVDNYFQERAILAPQNEEVELINDYIISKIPGEEVSYFSSDNVCPSEVSNTFEDSLHSPDILNSIKVSGIPNHKITLKVGVPIILLRNIDQSNGLCNGTRLQVTRLGTHMIEAKVISGKNIGVVTYIPRMKLVPSDLKIPFKFQRRQFPIMVCFAMTINKSQGQSLSKVGLFLKKPVFSHGQLYVAVSRVKSKDGLKVLIADKEGNSSNKTMNVVYKEVLHKI